MSEVNADIYARAQTPAIDPSMHNVTIEDEAQALYRRILKSEGGEREYNIGILHSELRTLNRNIENGYTGWGFRMQVLKRTLQLLGVAS